MKLSDVSAAFESFSGTVSDLARKLGLAGIDVIWIFKIDHKAGSPSLPADLYLPLAIFCAGLFVDLLQYLYATIAWASALNFSGKSKDNDLIKVPEWINKPTWVFFALKIVCFLAGYILLLEFVIHNI